MISRALALTNITGTGAVSEALELMDGTAVSLYVGSRAGVTSGAVQLEEAPSKQSTSWLAVGTPLTVPAAGALAVQRPTAPAAYGALRARVSTTIVGGVIDVWIVAG
jgi:hypothetical protein